MPILGYTNGHSVRSVTDKQYEFNNTVSKRR